MNEQPTNTSGCELWFRKKLVVNTDPQRRCYNGCNFSERVEWSAWALIGPYSLEDAYSSAATFKRINQSDEYEVRPRPYPCAHQSELK